MPEHFLEWDPAQVAQHFLEELGEDLRSAFIEHDINGSLLPFLTTSHLRELGIELLASRLRLKKKINELLASKFTSGGSKTLQNGDLHLRAIDINSNYVSIEALSLCLTLLQDLSHSTRQISDEMVDLKTLNEKFQKLKVDLNPVLRLAKDSKPLPRPTLDPGPLVSLPTQSVSSLQSSQSWLTSDFEGGHTPTTATTLVLPESSASRPGNSPNIGHFATNLSSPTESTSAGSTRTQPSVPPKTNIASSSTKPKISSSPTFSHRFSAGSVLSMGVGKVTDMKLGSLARLPARPRIVEAKKSSSSCEDIHEENGDKISHIQDSRPAVSRSKLSSGSVTSNPASVNSVQASQPLKQLKASSDDTCLKVLQHAMKRHHIPREKWSKYVLVVCYGDKERIIKLTEKPVMIFKELQEHGHNPTIMLRERASGLEDEGDYENSRIGDDIPGGTL